MTRILTIGDPHFKTNNSYETDIMHRSIVQTIREKQPDAVVILGDVLDRFELIHVKVFNRVLSFIEDILNESKDVTLIIGNHDRPNNNIFLTDEHPFNALKKWNNITIVDRTLIREINGTPFVFVPYVSPGRFREALKTVELDHQTENGDCIQSHLDKTQQMAGFFAHNEFYGAKMGIVKSTVGDLWPSDAPFLVSGHIHDYDRLQPNLCYTGTPIQHGISDSGDKTISLFTYEYKDTSWKMTNEERIDLNVPKKLRLKLTKEELLEFKLIANATIIRIDVELDPIEYSNLIKNPKIIELINAGVKIKPIDTRNRIASNESVTRLYSKIPYSRRLINSVETLEPNVKKVFEELFTVPLARKKISIIPRSETESPKTESPKTESPKTESPKTESPKTESPKTESPKTETPKTETPKNIKKRLIKILR